MNLQLNSPTVGKWVRRARRSWKKLALGLGAVGASILLISCVTSSRVLVTPPHIAGASFVGSDACAECHETVTKPFKTATHAGLRARGTNSVEVGCESCHGAGSLHVEAGGGRGNIINPSRSPQVCFDCHLDKRGEFNLPFHHPVMEGKLSCNDCHDPHKGPAVKSMGTTFASVDQSCARCHAKQHGPFVFEHEAVREGCTTCHAVHGSVNNKLLTQRNQSLCLKCHFQQQTASDSLVVGGLDHSRFVARGTCWSAGCHEAVHGSQVSSSLRF